MLDTNNPLALALAIAEMPWLQQLLAVQGDLWRTSVDYQFNAPTFYGQHVFKAKDVSKPENDVEAGAAVWSAILASNQLAGGGAAGYLAVLDLMMIAFRRDYPQADDLLRQYVLRASDADSQE